MSTRPDVVLIGFVGGTGGTSVVMRDLAHRLTARGLRVRVVVPKHETTRGFVRELRESGIEAVRTSLLLARPNRVESYIAAARLVRRHRAPVVHFHSSDNVLVHYLLVALRLWRAPRSFVTTHHPYDGPFAGEPMARRWAAASVDCFDAVIGVSRAGRDRHVGYGVPASRTALIYNGVDLERFSSGDGYAARRELGLAPDAELIVVTGRLAAQKRPLDAVGAFARLAPTRPSAHLVLVGTGPLETEIREAARRAGLEGRVHLVGHRKNVEDWLAAASAWFLPTESEGFALAVIEAMAAGRAIVSTRCPGNDEVLVDGENALLAEVGDVDAMARQLGRVLSDASLRERLSAAARRDASRFSLDRMVEQHLALYEGRRSEVITPRSRHVSTEDARAARRRATRARVSRMVWRVARRALALFISG